MEHRKKLLIVRVVINPG